MRPLNLPIRLTHLIRFSHDPVCHNYDLRPYIHCLKKIFLQLNIFNYFCSHYEQKNSYISENMRDNISIPNVSGMQEQSV
jgi:hypothetical protein